MADITYHVDLASGDDGDDGSESTPWATLSFALATGITAHDYDNDTCIIEFRGASAPAGDIGLTWAIAAATGTPDAAHSLILRPYAGYGPDTGNSPPGPTIVFPSDSGTIVTNATDYLTVEGIQFYNSGTGIPNAKLFDGNATTGVTFRSCAFLMADRSFGGSAYHAEFHTGWTFENCVFVGCSVALRRFGGSSDGPTFRNCVFAEMDANVIVGEAATMYNCAFFNCAGISDTAFAGGGNNWRDSGSPDPGGSTFAGATLTAVDFVDPGVATYDYRGAASGLLDGAGDAANDTATDMFGTARDGSTPDIGYYEIVAAAGGAAIDVIAKYYRNLLAGGM